MKIKKIIAVLVDDLGDETEVALTDLSPFCNVFNYTKVHQPANPMAPGTKDMFGLKFEISTDYAIDETVEEE